MSSGSLISYGQSVEKIQSGLAEAGFENVRVVAGDQKYTISVENHVYRWDVRAITEALRSISANLEQPGQLELILMENQVPQYLISVNSGDWKKFQAGEISGEELSSKLLVTRQTDDAWKTLKPVKASYANRSKVDLYLYPQFSFENRLLAKLFEVQLNIAPLLTVSVRKGMKLSGQVIFPIYNELGYEGNFIRPGYITVSQDYRLPGRWFGQLVAGNFGSSRYGLESNVNHTFRNENWNLEINLGYTGSSHYFDRTWLHSKMNTFTWSSSLSYFYSKFNLECKAGIARYIYGDHGLFASCSRNFGETSIGFYAQLGKENSNGGFYFSIPFPTSKRRNHKAFRVSLPKHYDFIYDAGTEFQYGQNFMTNPDNNKYKNATFTQLITKEILTFKNK
jgi:hypothetical protein